jgi:hypothetical protein
VNKKMPASRWHFHFTDAVASGFILTPPFSKQHAGCH